MKSLDELLKNLESSTDVDAVFLTGSHGTTTADKNSDIDIVIILTANRTGIRSVYEIVDKQFADIFFFDNNELERLLDIKAIPGNSWDGMLISWLMKSDVRFDKSGLLAQLKGKAHQIKLIVPENEKNDILNKISYNFVQNQRYFSAQNSTYHDALAIRLMYSMVELLSGFLCLRDEPWRGEKLAIKYIKETAPEFYALFTEYQGVVELDEKMRIYTKMVHSVLPRNMYLFDYKNPLALSKAANTSQEIMRQNKFWDSIAR